MARVNQLALTGGILAIISSGLFWVPVFFVSSVFGSGDTNLTRTINGYLGTISILFIVGAILTLWTQLGVALELPGLIFLPFVIWYRDYSVFWMVGYVVAFIGTSMSTLSSFVQIAITKKTVRIPPESRIRVWFFWKDEHIPLKIPRVVAGALAVLIIIAVVASSAVLVDSYVRPLSKIDLIVVIASDIYGAVDLTVRLDGNEVVTTHFGPAPGMTYFSTEINLTAGSHTMVVDVNSATHPETNGIVGPPGTDRVLPLRVLPFATDTVEVGIGVGFQ